MLNEELGSEEVSLGARVVALVPQLASLALPQ